MGLTSSTPSSSPPLPKLSISQPPGSISPSSPSTPSPKPVEESKKDWEFSWKVITPEEQKILFEKVERLEEAYLHAGTEEGAKMAEELTTCTGFLLTYKVLLESKGKSLEDEMRDNSLSETTIRSARRRVDAKPPKPVYKDKDMKADYLLAISLYTSEQCYQTINNTLRGDKKSQVLKYANFTASFIKGFRILPSYWGKTYRGVCQNPDELEPGKILLFSSFTSTSESVAQAEIFMNRGTETKDEKHILFTIESRSGRSIQDLSFYPSEKEVVFRPFTSFRVRKKFFNTKEKRWEVDLEEAYPDTRGRKLLVWVDDVFIPQDPPLDTHRQEHKDIIQLCEKAGVTFVPLVSTHDALEFIEAHQNLLKRDLDGLRFISDMARVEDGKMNIQAGLDFYQQLTEKFDYKKRVLVFCGTQFLESNRKKFLSAQLDHVYVTARRKNCENFAKFLETDPTEEE